jgi:hypothetical protein
MEDPKQQLLAKLRDSANVLVTVTANPSVDQLAGAIGLTLLLNKLGKHATAVFSGRVPEVMEFLQPEATLEKNTDSLRDFIIALDKSKADKLRYKVEDTFVKIFITPYHTALTEKDLEFSQGDYNVDLILAIGVHKQQDLDQAITSHGQILHDAVISSINNSAEGGLGTINWVDPKASSLCEMIFDLTSELQPDGLDPQMATALLTGIVSETRRFGNDKTTAKSLETSSLLVAAGANQQLVAAKLEEHPAPIPEKKPTPAAAQPVQADGDPNKDPEAVPQTAGTVTIQHDAQPAETADSQIHIDEEGQLHAPDEAAQPAQPAAPTPVAAPQAEPMNDSVVEGGSKMILEPPTLGGLDEGQDPEQADPLAAKPAESAIPLLSHDSGPAQMPSAEPLTTFDQQAGKTLDQIETSLDSTHQAPEAQVADASTPDVTEAQQAVTDAANSMPDPYPKPIQALNAQHIELNPPPVEADPAPAPAPTPMPSMSFTSPAPAPAPSNEQTPPPVPPPLVPDPASNAQPAPEDTPQPQARPEPDLAQVAL